MTAAAQLTLAAPAAPVTLRPYQVAATANIRAMMRKHRRVLFCLPTGGGKTVIFTFITCEISRRGKRVVIVAHRREIVRQISKALDRQGVPHGLVVPRKPLTGDAVQVAMVQTLLNRLDLVEEPDLLVVDEAHHAVAGSWDTIKAAWPNAFHLGVTATPERLDGRGLRHAFDSLVLGPTPADLIALGALAGYQLLAPPADLDLSAVHTRAGDYALDELEQAVERSSIVGDAVEHYQRYLSGRPAIAFCISVRHAQAVAERFRAAGIPAASVDGSMADAERDAILAGLETGRVKVLCSCDLVSEGYDVPEVAGAILLRPTKSLALYLQQCGRALRPKADGSRAVILDHVGNVHRHGFPDTPREWSLDGTRGRRKAPGITVCKLCFHAFPAPVKHSPGFPCAAEDVEVCPFREVPETQGREIEEVEGDLVDVRAAQEDDAGMWRTSPPWADGLVVETAKGRDWFRLLELAGTDMDRLEEIRKARGYKSGWIGHQISYRYRIDQEVDEMLAGVRMPAEMQTGALWAALRRLGAQPVAYADTWGRVVRSEIDRRKLQQAA